MIEQIFENFHNKYTIQEEEPASIPLAMDSAIGFHFPLIVIGLSFRRLDYKIVVIIIAHLKKAHRSFVRPKEFQSESMFISWVFIYLKNGHH